MIMHRGHATRSHRVPLLGLLLALLSTMLIFLVGGARSATAAQTPAAWWWTGIEVTPSNLPPEGEGTIIAVVSDLGAGTANGEGGDPVVISVRLPPQLEAIEISGPVKHGVPSTCSLATLQCTYAGIIYPYERLTIAIKVKVKEPIGTVTTLPTEVSVQGAGAARGASSVQKVHISSAPTPFGVSEEGFELAPYDQEGSPATQAGSHPFQLTSTQILNQTGTLENRQPVAQPRNLSFRLPLGLIGDPQATEQCPSSEFEAHKPVSEVNLCPPGSVVGVASVTIDEPKTVKVVTLAVPLFNLVPSEGEPARFGFDPLGIVPIAVTTSVDPSDDYDVIATVKNATQLAGLLSSQVTFWGVPGDPRHNQSRGWECIENSEHHEKGEVSTPCPTSTTLPETPLLRLPTSCPVSPASERLRISALMESWTEREHQVESEYTWAGPLGEPLGFTGCDELPFEPQLQVRPEAGGAVAVHSGGTPSGLSVGVRLPQGPTLEANPEGRGEADVRDTTVTLPAGVQLNPSAANGLEACPETHGEGAGYEGVGFEGFQKFLGGEREPDSEVGVFTSGFRFVEEGGLPPSCPRGSKVGVVHIKTPLLPKELEGAVYLAEPAPNGEAGKNPFNSLIALYLVAEDKEAGVLVKLAGEGRLNQSTGQLSTVFRDTPQLPFEELTVELFGGQRASISTPSFCGDYSTTAEFTPWSLPLGSSPVDRLSNGEEFAITEGCASGGVLGFSPVFDAQSTSVQAGGFTGFSVQLARADGQQALSGLSVRLPPGISALLATLTPCPEPPVGQPWACGPASLIGHSLVSSGVGSEPVTLGGDAYLTVGYDGAPFGILDETEAKAGPFNLGKVYVRSKIEVNPQTAAVTITTDPGPHDDALPTILKGVPVQLKALTVNVERSSFELNPTNCDPMSIGGTLDGGEGASVGVSSAFQVGGCQGLPFAPRLTAVAGGDGSKADGTSFAVRVESGGVGPDGVVQAGIAKVDLQLPLALSSRLPTLQKACTEVVFDSNPASCDEGSVIGYATIHTPVLSSVLSGPAYLVSHGAAFPDVEFVLQGEGITLVLDGKTDIKKGITYSRFESAPDAPFTVFETVLPAGPHGVLTPNVPEREDFSLCKASLQMPTVITGQNGAVIDQTTKIATSGCQGVKGSKTVRLTRAQMLTRALAACRKRYKHAKAKRAACEKLAHKKYTAKKASRKKPHAAARTTTAPDSRASDSRVPGSHRLARAR
jgi:hypothetical protein